MDLGKFEIEQLSEGFFEVFADKSLRKMNPVRLNNLRKDASLGKYSTAIGIDPLLIKSGGTKIILDAGLGWGLDYKSDYKETSNVKTNLEIFGIHPEDVEHVILSHLHYDHSAGSTFVDEYFKTSVTFPNAQYLVQQSEWDYAIEEQKKQQQPATGAGYKMDELYRLAAENRFHFIDREKFELVPGIDILHTGGHTPGHQIVRISDQGKSAFYLGDLIPTEYHLNHYAMKQMDFDPIQSKKIKTLLLKEAFSSGSYLFFYHSLFRKNGILARDEHKKYVLLEG